MAKSRFAPIFFALLSHVIPELQWASSRSGERKVTVEGGWELFLDASVLHNGRLVTFEFNGCVFHWCALVRGRPCTVCSKGDWGCADGTIEARARKHLWRVDALQKHGV